MPQSKLTKSLLDLYDGEVEHVGFVMSKNKVVQVENVSDSPATSFDVRGEDIIKYGDKALATWHTHPNGTSNLSAGDMETFLNWPDIPHYIIGTDGITKYIVVDGEVLID